MVFILIALLGIYRSALVLIAGSIWAIFHILIITSGR